MQKAAKIAQNTGKVHINYTLCLFCGACVGACPGDAIFMWMTYLEIASRACTGCARCVQVCPIGAVTMTGGSA